MRPYSMLTMASTLSVPRLCILTCVPIPRYSCLLARRSIFLHPQRCNASGLSKPKKKKKKQRTEFRQYDLKDAVQFNLCDAMRYYYFLAHFNVRQSSIITDWVSYIRAFEVGRSPTVSKYELAIRLRTVKNGPVVRNNLRLPHPVDTSLRVAVICPPDSPAAARAAKAGASLVGEDSIIDAVKGGRIEFDRLLCHPDSHTKMNNAGLGRILGPRG